MIYTITKIATELAMVAVIAVVFIKKWMRMDYERARKIYWLGNAGKGIKQNG